MCERECVKEGMCDKVVCESWRRGGAGRSGRERERETESKTRTPHKDVGNKKCKLTAFGAVTSSEDQS